MMRGDGKWIAAASEVLYDGSPSAMCQQIADLLNQYGTEAVLDAIADAADAAHDHLADVEAPIEGVTHAEARHNIDTVRKHLRAALAVL